MNRKRIILYLAIFLLLAGLVCATPPGPHSISGTIYMADVSTQMPLGTLYQLSDLNTGFVLRSATSVPVPGLTGVYFETVDGSDGDIIVVTAWNATTYGKKSYTLSGDLSGADVWFNTTRPPEIVVRITTPQNNSIEQINKTFDVTADLTAVGGSDSYACNATIRFSNNRAMSLVNGETITHSLGAILLHTSLRTTWKVLAARGWGANITVISKCITERESFDKLTNYTAYNITVNDSIGPKVFLQNPANRSWTRTRPTLFFYNVTDFSGVKNCSILIDGIINLTRSSVPVSTTVNFSVSLRDGNHTWFIQCYDNSSRHNKGQSIPYLLKVDTVAPVISLIYPDPYFVSDNNSVLFRYSVDDANPVSNCSLVIGGSVRRLSKPIVRLSAQNFSYFLGHGQFSWSVNCTDVAGNVANSSQRLLNITDPDLFVSKKDLKFGNLVPSEGQNVSINLTVHNIGDRTASLVLVKLYDNSLLNNFATFNLSSVVKKGNLTIQTSWRAKVGKHVIIAVVDPPIATNGSIFEINESNNIVNATIFTSLWQVFYGSIAGQFALDKHDNTALVLWSNISNFFGNIYIIDSDSQVSWGSLQALGRNLSNRTELDDFVKLDRSLNTTALNDSVNRTYVISNQMTLRSIIVFDKNITNVPIAQSANDDNFFTGILWDYSDSQLTNYDGTQDVVFVGNIQHAAGAFGTYDYEIKIPAYLRKYRKPNTFDSVTFYTELT